LTVDPRQDTGVSRSIDDPVDCRQIFQVAGIADVAVKESHTSSLQWLAIIIAPGANEIMQTENLHARIRVEQGAYERAASEPTAAGNDYFHFVGSRQGKVK